MRKLLNRFAYPLGYKIERISRFQREIDALVRLQRPFRFVRSAATRHRSYDGAILGMIDFARFLPRIIKYEYKNMPPTQQIEVKRHLETHGYRVANDGGDAVAWRAG